MQCDRLPHSPVWEYVGRWHPDNIWQELNISAGGFTAGYLSVSLPDIRAQGYPLQKWWCQTEISDSPLGVFCNWWKRRIQNSVIGVVLNFKPISLSTTVHMTHFTYIKYDDRKHYKSRVFNFKVPWTRNVV